MSTGSSQSEATRLEGVWSGTFGDEYVDRNDGECAHRGPFWDDILGRTSPDSVLEVGSNLGGNLEWVAHRVVPDHIWAIDVNPKALRILRSRLPDVNAVSSPARSIPFRDRMFDLVFSTVVLIHQPPETLPIVMSEMVRCSRRWVMCAEYFAPEPTEVPYRGLEGALFKRDFGRDFLRLFPELRLEATGFLGEAETGWDDVTWWLFERT